MSRVFFSEHLTKVTSFNDLWQSHANFHTLKTKHQKATGYFSHLSNPISYLIYQYKSALINSHLPVFKNQQL